MKRKITRKAITAVSLATVMMTTTANASVLGQSSEGAVNTGYQEVFGLAEVAGLIGVVACGGLVFIGQKDLAKKVGICVVCGFLILKYAEPIWDMIAGGI